jgi:hypothetical protein
MPFTSPFGSIITPSFNPSYSNVPQNKPPKPAAVPRANPTPKVPEGNDSINELTAGVTPKVFIPQESQVSAPAEFNPTSIPTMPTQIPQLPMAMPTPMPQLPMAIPPAFNPYNAYFSQMIPPQMAGQRVVAPQLPQRLNPGRPIFV